MEFLENESTFKQFALHFHKAKLHKSNPLPPKIAKYKDAHRKQKEIDYIDYDSIPEFMFFSNVYEEYGMFHQCNITE